jgi:DNA adenine methylase
MKTHSALSWFGSDGEVAEQLAAMLDHCNHVTITFCGGLSILPYLKARAVVANDKHDRAINFYRHASGIHGTAAQVELFERCKRTLSHPSEMARAVELLNHGDTVDSAWAMWALCWLGRKGKGGTKNQSGMPSIRRTASGGTNASRIRAAADDLPESWAKHFERCEWECQDFRPQLGKVADHPDCGLYLDGPWDGPGAGYLHSFKREDHRDLAMCVQRFHQTTVVIRYGDTPLIRSLYEGWQIIEAESRDQCNAVKGELWITNRWK